MKFKKSLLILPITAFLAACNFTSDMIPSGLFQSDESVESKQSSETSHSNESVDGHSSEESHTHSDGSVHSNSHSDSRPDDSVASKSNDQPSNSQASQSQDGVSQSTTSNQSGFQPSVSPTSQGGGDQPITGEFTVPEFVIEDEQEGNYGQITENQWNLALAKLATGNFTQRTYMKPAATVTSGLPYEESKLTMQEIKYAGTKLEGSSKQTTSRVYKSNLYPTYAAGNPDAPQTWAAYLEVLRGMEGVTIANDRESALFEIVDEEKPVYFDLYQNYGYEYYYDEEVNIYKRLFTTFFTIDTFLNQDQVYNSLSFAGAVYSTTNKCYKLDIADDSTGALESYYVYFANGNLSKVLFEQQSTTHSAKTAIYFSNFGTTSVTFPTDLYVCKNHGKEKSYESAGASGHYAVCAECTDLIGALEEHSFDLGRCTECYYEPSEEVYIALKGNEKAVILSRNTILNEFTNYRIPNANYDSTAGGYINREYGYVVKVEYNSSTQNDSDCSVKQTTKLYFCDLEGNVLHDPVDLVYYYYNHDYSVKLNEVDEGCYTYTTYQCSRCGKTRVDITENHKYVEVSREAKDPDEPCRFLVKYECSVCHEILNEYEYAHDYKMDNPENLKDFMGYASVNFTCSRCNDRGYGYGLFTGYDNDYHYYSINDYSSSKEGYTDYKDPHTFDAEGVCTVCGFRKQTKKCTECTFGPREVENKSYCTTLYKETCTTCGYTQYTREQNHDFHYYISSSEPLKVGDKVDVEVSCYRCTEKAVVEGEITVLTDQKHGYKFIDLEGKEVEMIDDHSIYNGNPCYYCGYQPQLIKICDHLSYYKFNGINISVADDAYENIESDYVYDSELGKYVYSYTDASCGIVVKTYQSGEVKEGCNRYSSYAIDIYNAAGEKIKSDTALSNPRESHNYDDGTELVEGCNVYHVYTCQDCGKQFKDLYTTKHALSLPTDMGANGIGRGENYEYSCSCKECNETFTGSLYWNVQESYHSISFDGYDSNDKYVSYSNYGPHDFDDSGVCKVCGYKDSSIRVTNNIKVVLLKDDYSLTLEGDAYSYWGYFNSLSSEEGRYVVDGDSLYFFYVKESVENCVAKGELHVAKVDIETETIISDNVLGVVSEREQHNYGPNDEDIQVVIENCQEYHKGKCRDCGKEFNEYYGVHHTYVVPKQSEPDYYEIENATVKCSSCGETHTGYLVYYIENGTHSYFMMDMDTYETINLYDNEPHDFDANDVCKVCGYVNKYEQICSHIAIGKNGDGNDYIIDDYASVSYDTGEYGDNWAEIYTFICEEDELIVVVTVCNFYDADCYLYKGKLIELYHLEEETPFKVIDDYKFAEKQYDEPQHIGLIEDAEMVTHDCGVYAKYHCDRCDKDVEELMEASHNFVLPRMESESYESPENGERATCSDCHKVFVGHFYIYIDEESHFIIFNSENEDGYEVSLEYIEGAHDFDESGTCKVCHYHQEAEPEIEG